MRRRRRVFCPVCRSHLRGPDFLEAIENNLRLVHELVTAKRELAAANARLRTFPGKRRG